MTTRVRTNFRDLIGGLATRRLMPLEFLFVLGVALVFGTIYCQIYCLLALQQMGGQSMTLLGSVFRAGSDVVPALLLFELGKRIDRRSAARFALVLILLFAAMLAAAVALRLEASVMMVNRSLRQVTVDRLPYLLASTAALLFVLRRSALSINPVTANDDSDFLMPPVQVIDWVRAAGNYVELHVHGRTKLLRGTLRQTAAVLPDDQFVQIHRSVIVNRARIESVEGSQRVKMRDGTVFTIGDAYRSNVRAA